jgi:hypothetical protein
MTQMIRIYTDKTSVGIRVASVMIRGKLLTIDKVD